MFKFSKNIEFVCGDPHHVFKIPNFFEWDDYKKISENFPNINEKILDHEKNFGKFSLMPNIPKEKNNETKDIFGRENILSYSNENQKEILKKLHDTLMSSSLFNFFTSKVFLKNALLQKNLMKTLKYLRPASRYEGKKSILDFFFSKLETRYVFSFIKNKGGIFPHTDAQRKYLSLMIYFPDKIYDDKGYGTTFWNSNIKNYKNIQLNTVEELKEFKKNSEISYKTDFEPNCLYGFLRSDLSWHSVEPLDINKNYIRKSININMKYINLI